MAKPDFEVPSGPINEQLEYWQANSSRWFVHCALQELRGHYDDTHHFGDLDPYMALQDVALDPRVEGLGLNQVEFNAAVLEQLIRFNRNRPIGMRAIVALASNTYRDRIWGLPGYDY